MKTYPLTNLLWQARMATSAQQVAELASQMEALMQEKQHLESQNRVLQHTVQLSTRHFSEVLTEKVTAAHLGFVQVV